MTDGATGIWTPETTEPAPAVIVAGDLMARDGKGLAARIGPALAAKGYVAVAANPKAHRDTKEFKKGTLSARVGEVEDVVTQLFERMIAAGKVDIRKIAVVGHGVGGAVAVAEAARDSRVGAAIAIGAPRTPEAYFPKDVQDAWAKGKTARVQGCDGTLHDLDRAIQDDWKAQADLDHSTASRKTGADVVWIHGTADEKVSVEESRRSYWKHPEAGRRARLVEIQGADHKFSGEAYEKKLVDAVVEQLEQVFRK